MAKCMICGAEIGADQDTFEHLIPAAIGGRRGLRDFIHRCCNSKAGDTWDAELARQLHPLSLMFDIKRQRGEVPSASVTTTADERLTIGPGGELRHTDPIFKKTPLGDGKQSIQIKARDMNEARRMLRDLKRKNPEIDVEALMAAAQVERSYAKGAVHHALGIGGPLAGRSIVKSLLAMAFAHGIDWNVCQNALDYIRDQNAQPSYGFYTERDLVTGRVVGMPLHCLAVHADPDSGLILAYAEYYGVFRIVALLGEGYSGPAVKGCYALDPRDGTEQDVRVDLPFGQSDIADIYAYRRVDFAETGRALAAVIEPALASQNAREQERVIATAVQKAFESCGAKPGEMLTEEHVRRITRTMASEITPYLLHRMRPVEPPKTR